MERINRFEMEHKEEENKRPDISKERLQMMGMDFSDSEDEDDHLSLETPKEESKNSAYNFGMVLKSKAKFANLGSSV